MFVGSPILTVTPLVHDKFFLPFFTIICFCFYQAAFFFFFFFFKNQKMKKLLLLLLLPPSSSSSTTPLVLLLLHFCIIIHAQQTYVNNIQLNCDRNDTTALGYLCNNNNNASSSCSSYLTFRSQPPLFNTPSSIASLLRSDPASISRINNISSVNSLIPPNTLIIVPIDTCSCSYPLSSQPPRRQLFFQHNSSYIFNNSLETYFSISNNTFQGLTTCQALTNHNPFNFRQLAIGMNISIPLRCACPTPNQTANGIRYLLTYLITWGDSIESIASTFRVPDPQTLLDANELSTSSIIFPFTPLLVPLTTEPTAIDLSTSPPPPPPAPPVIPIGNGDSNSSRTWVFVGVGVGVGLLLLLSLSGFLVWYFRRTRRARAPHQTPKTDKAPGSSDHTYLAVPDSNSWSVSAEGLRFAVESLTVYNYQDLEAATNSFSEENRINGQVYRGSFKGDYAAVKIMKGDVSGEINILKQINHSNIIRLSGFCLHKGNTYLVYEYAENGSLDDWICGTTAAAKDGATPSVLGWKERVQIAYNIADALNYIHNFSNPPYIHKNLKSSNVLLDAHMRAKITNFGLARSVDDEDEEGLQLTRHVIGTYGYMPPEYIENGLITPKMDVFALGVIMLELLSGKEAAPARDKEADDKEANKHQELQLSARISEVLGGENVREKLTRFMDAKLRDEYPLDLAYSMAQLASSCVAHDLNSRPSTSELLMTISKILSSSMDWDPSDELEHSRSLSIGR